MWFKATEKNLREGARVRCRIRGDVITDARIRRLGNFWYICQNVSSGRELQSDLRYGYRFSWAFFVPEGHITLAGCFIIDRISDMVIEIPLCPREEEEANGNS